jgi:hypothetical protein
MSRLPRRSSLDFPPSLRYGAASAGNDKRQLFTEVTWVLNHRLHYRVLTNCLHKVNRVTGRFLSTERALMKTRISPRSGRWIGWSLFAALIFSGFANSRLRAQNEPILVPDVVDYKKLIPILPEPPSGWTADAPDGSTEDVGGFKLTSVHRDYHKGEQGGPPAAAITIIDSAANPDYVAATTGTWTQKSEGIEGYSKPVTIDGNPGFEAYEIEQKHASLWVMVGKRYFVEIELRNRDPKELQEWVKRIDLKKLAEIK